MATKKRNLIIKTKAIRNQMVKKMGIRAKASRNQAKIKKRHIKWSQYFLRKSEQSRLLIKMLS